MRAWSLILLVACGGDAGDSGGSPLTGTAPGSTTSSGATSSTGPLSHDLDIQPIWDATCGTTCHLQDDDGGLTLSYEAIVSVPSSDVPSMNLVEPGSLEDSYLWHKLEGTHLSVGGAGSQMPRGLVELKPRKRAKIERWIVGGALP